MEAKPGSRSSKTVAEKAGRRVRRPAPRAFGAGGHRGSGRKSPDVPAFLLAGVSLILGLLVLVGLSAAIVIAFWETHRMAAILTLCAIYAVIMIICISQAISLAKKCAAPFQATLEELERNRERLLP